MKAYAIVFFLILCFVGQGFGYTVRAVLADSPFAVYPGDASWETEMVFLENFSIYLDEHPEMMGHIVYYSSKIVSRRKLEKRIRRSIKYLTQDQEIPRERLKPYYGGAAEDSKIVLQPLRKKRIIREEYLKITPYVSTLEDVTKVYGEGHGVIKGREDYLSIDYTINENIEVSIDYFRDCNQTEKPENERTWIVEEVFFTFEEDLKLKPKDIFLDKKDFTACPYGDVGGQIIFFRKEKDIEFTYLSLVKAVSNLSVMATEKNKERYKCKKDKVIFSLDPEGFRCNSPD